MVSNLISTADVIAEVAAGQGKPLAFLARRLPALRGDNSTHPATITRWIIRGVRTATGERIHLEAVRLASRWISTEAAVRRFLERQASPVDSSSGITPRTPTKRTRDADRAGQELAKLGV